MTLDRPLSAEEFLAARHQHAEVNDTDRLGRFDDQLRDMCTVDPDRAVAIMEALSRSDDLGAKEAVAIYVKYLFPVRRERATELLLALLNDPDADTQSQAIDTLDVVTSDRWITRTEANQLHAQ